MMGRHGDASKRHFRIFKKEDMAYERAECLYCKKEMADHSTKQKEHLAGCVAYQNIASNSSPVQRTFTKKRHAEYLTFITADDQKKSEKEMSDFIFGDGVPLNTVDSPLFRKFVAGLNPHFNLPSRRTLSETLLDGAYDETFSNIEREIKEAFSLSLIFDAWTNIRHEPVVGFVITTPKSFFWKALHSEDLRHTADFYVEQCSKIIDAFGADKFAAVVTDNASTMTKAWRIIEAKYPGIVCFGCLAHVLNLLIGDIFRVTLPSDLMNTCGEVIKFFGRSSICDMIFQKKRAELSISRDLVEPVTTRWASQISCLESFLINKAVLQQVMLDDRIASKIEPRLKKAMLDDDFFTEVTRLYVVLRPLKDLIDVLESKQSTISVAISHYHSFWKLATEVGHEVSYKEELLRFIGQRWSMFYHPVMTLAHILDPKNDIRNLPSIIDVEEDVEKAMMQLIPDETKRNRTYAQYMQYKAREGPFVSKALWAVLDNNLVESLCWWKANYKDKASELCELAERVLTIPCSSAAIERSFSSYGYIHSSSRNRLTPARSEKLVFLYYNLKQLKEQ